MPSSTTIEICQGPECGPSGGAELARRMAEEGFPVERGHCRGLCHEAPVAVVGSRVIASACRARLLAVLQDPGTP